MNIFQYSFTLVDVILCYDVNNMLPKGGFYDYISSTKCQQQVRQAALPWVISRGITEASCCYH